MILLTGGAGYIGSHVNKLLTGEGYDTLVYDNLSTGRRERLKWGNFVLGDLKNINQLNLLFEENCIESIMHFAGSIIAPESIKKPLKYYKNNVANVLCLLDIVKKFKVPKFIFSSTAAVYGNAKDMPIKEDALKSPLNPYGRTKLMIERILSDFAKANKYFRYVVLRYFNAAGADPEGEVGYYSKTHLIAKVIDAALGRADSVKIFGTDYDTRDGTCVRDFIHVNDLAWAHLKAMDYLGSKGESDDFNLGVGKGFTVKEIIKGVEQISGVDFKVTEADRREGDPAINIADYSKAEEILKWKPKYDNIIDILKTAWNWQKKQ